MSKNGNRRRHRAAGARFTRKPDCRSGSAAFRRGGLHGHLPSGASTGKYEALELRDGDMRVYGGKGVQQACARTFPAQSARCAAWTRAICSPSTMRLLRWTAQKQGRARRKRDAGRVGWHAQRRRPARRIWRFSAFWAARRRT
ncbi:MAG: hypothetical protein ACLR4A_15880 [Christensenellales bacterium]